MSANADHLPAIVETPVKPRLAVAVRHTVQEDFSVYRPAGFKLRWYALTLDLTFAAPVDVIVRLPFQRYLERLHAFGHSEKYWALTTLLLAITMLLMVVAPTMLWGQTLGKRIVGIRVVKANFIPELSLMTVLLRETVGKVLSLALFGIGFFMAGFGDRGQALHDYIARTHVIRFRVR